LPGNPRKSHRIGLKKIVLQSDTFKYLEYRTGVKDGVNVRKTNTMECDLKMITALHGNVGILILNLMCVCGSQPSHIKLIPPNISKTS
jgi:hypothetical protein